MRPGQSIEFVRDINLPPTKSNNTRLISAAFSCGLKPLPEGAYSDTVQETASGPKRTVTWAMDGDVKAVFEPIAEREEITFLEFRTRFNDLDWCLANANHPIAYLRAFCDNEKRLLEFVKGQKPSILIERNGRTVVLPADCKPEIKQKILAML
jgi:hypothetical protein